MLWLRIADLPHGLYTDRLRTLGARDFQADTHLAETLGFILYMTARRFI